MTRTNSCEKCGQVFGTDEGGVPIERDKRNPDRCEYCANPLDDDAMMAMYEFFNQGANAPILQPQTR